MLFFTKEDTVKKWKKFYAFHLFHFLGFFFANDFWFISFFNFHVFNKCFNYKYHTQFIFKNYIQSKLFLYPMILWWGLLYLYFSSAILMIKFLFPFFFFFNGTFSINRFFFKKIKKKTSKIILNTNATTLLFCAL